MKPQTKTFILAMAAATLAPALIAQRNEQVLSGTPTAPIGFRIAIENESFRGDAQIIACGTTDRVRTWENGVEQPPWMGLSSVRDVALLPVPGSGQTFLAVGQWPPSGPSRVQIRDLRSGTTWTVQSPLASGSAFGEAVALTLRGGVPILAVSDSSNGQVHLFAFDAFGGWIPEQTLQGATGEAFGVDVAVYGSDVIVGAPNASTWVRGGGAVHFFHHDGASYQPGFTMDSFLPDSWLGRSVDISKDFAVAGQPGTAGLGPEEGTVVFFERSGSSFSYEWDLSANEAYAGLGSAVAIHSVGSAPYIVAGKPGYDGSAGEASMFTRINGSWQRLTNWRSTASSPNASYGASVAISDRFTPGSPRRGLAVGATADSQGAGRVYVYDFIQWPTQSIIGSGTAGHLGQVPTIGGVGGLQSGHRFELWATGRPGAPAAMVFGPPSPPTSLFGVDLHLQPLITLAQPLDVFGRWETTIHVPPGINGWVRLAAQAVIFDVDGPQGFAASPGLFLQH